MAETVTGKKCPECGSFVPTEAKRCLVCSHEVAREKSPKSARNGDVELTTVKCSQCRRECTPGTRLCPHCGSAVGRGEEHDTKKIVRKEAVPAAGESKGQKCRFIRFDWIKMTPGYTMLNALELNPGIPLFDGFVQWEGYGFFLYQNRKRNEILIRKTDPQVAVKLFRKCEKASLVEPRTEIYIGAMGIEVIGGASDRKKSKESDTIANVTNYVGPGEKRKSDDSCERPAADFDSAVIRFLDTDTEVSHIELKEKTLIGRAFLARELNMKEDALRTFGISQKHVHITAGEEQWLVEPVNRKPVYIEIKETPVIAREGDVFRWMFVDCFGEFKIRVVED